MNRKELLKHVLVGAAVVGVAVGALFAVKKARELYANKPEKGQVAEVTHMKPEVTQKKEAKRKPVKVKLVDDDEDDT